MKIRRVAVIPPLEKRDYLVNTVLDGLDALRAGGEVESFALSEGYPVPSGLSLEILPELAFRAYAREADAVLLLWGKKKPNWKLADQLDCWAKTAFIEGSEPGGDRRFEVAIQRAIMDGASRIEGAVNLSMLQRCAAYFRREKPILPGMHSLPFGIERRYCTGAQAAVTKDIDFFCIFGQDKHPLLRRAVAEEIRRFCGREGFRCATEKVPPEQFYQLLARSKVGVSVGGGGYDTARFWEILGGNCLLLTERIDLVPPLGTTFAFGRIHEFGSLYDLVDLLPRIGRFLREAYDPAMLAGEYEEILRQHSSAARVRQILATLESRVGTP